MIPDRKCVSCLIPSLVLCDSSMKSKVDTDQTLLHTLRNFAGFVIRRDFYSTILDEMQTQTGIDKDNETVKKNNKRDTMLCLCDDVGAYRKIPASSKLVSRSRNSCVICLWLVFRRIREKNQSNQRGGEALNWYISGNGERTRYWKMIEGPNNKLRLWWCPLLRKCDACRGNEWQTVKYSLTT
jgi:hypothetical protein